jgi:hypothetical protein
MANIDKINDMLRNGEIGSLVRQVERPKKPPVRHDNKVKDQIPTLTGTQLSLIGIRQHIDVG